jgi:hypothetical protein
MNAITYLGIILYYFILLWNNVPHSKEGIIKIISFSTKVYLIKSFVSKFDLIFIILNFCGIL